MMQKHKTNRNKMSLVKSVVGKIQSKVRELRNFL